MRTTGHAVHAGHLGGSGQPQPMPDGSAAGGTEAREDPEQKAYGPIAHALRPTPPDGTAHRTLKIS